MPELLELVSKESGETTANTVAHETVGSPLQPPVEGTGGASGAAAPFGEAGVSASRSERAWSATMAGPSVPTKTVAGGYMTVCSTFLGLSGGIPPAVSANDRYCASEDRIAHWHSVLATDEQRDMLSGLGLACHDAIESLARGPLVLKGLDQIAGAVKDRVIHDSCLHMNDIGN